MNGRKVRLFCAGIVLSFCWASGLLLGCGGFDSEVLAQEREGEALISMGGAKADQLCSGAEERDDQTLHEEGEVIAGDALQDEMSSETEGNQDENSDDGDDPYVQDSRCAVICFKLAWCQPDGVDLPQCIETCENAAEEGILAERILNCYEEAQTCSDLGRCHDRVEACTEVCDVMDYCGEVDHGPGCYQWCAEEILASRLDWGAQGCIVSAGAQMACDEVQYCGLSW